MYPCLPSIRSEDGLRTELHARTQEQEAPPILTAEPAHKYRITSALQKCVRRGHTDLAVRLAVQLHSIDPQYAWKRLCIIALEDVGFGDCLSAALALEANRSFVFRQKLGELRTLAAVVTGLAEGTKSRALCDLLCSRPSYTYPPANEIEVPEAIQQAPWMVQHLFLRGRSHAKLGHQVPEVWALLRELSNIEREPDPFGDELIHGLPAASFDMYTGEGKRMLAYVSKCGPFRRYTPAQIGMAIFHVEGAHLNRSIGSVELGALDLCAKLVDFRSVGVGESTHVAELMRAVREQRALINHARRRILG